MAGDETFATQFFANYIEGRDVPDYPRLLDRAGFLLRSSSSAGRGNSFEVVPAEAAGQTVTEAQRRFRDAWLSSGARNIF